MRLLRDVESSKQLINIENYLVSRIADYKEDILDTLKKKSVIGVYRRHDSKFHHEIELFAEVQLRTTPLIYSSFIEHFAQVKRVRLRAIHERVMCDYYRELLLASKFIFVKSKNKLTLTTPTGNWEIISSWRKQE